jgi:hypothetical protein
MADGVDLLAYGRMISPALANGSIVGAEGCAAWPYAPAWQATTGAGPPVLPAIASGNPGSQDIRAWRQSAGRSALTRARWANSATGPSPAVGSSVSSVCAAFRSRSVRRSAESANLFHNGWAIVGRRRLADPTPPLKFSHRPRKPGASKILIRITELTDVARIETKWRAQRPPPVP